MVVAVEVNSYIYLLKNNVNFNDQEVVERKLLSNHIVIQVSLAFFNVLL